MLSALKNKMLEMNATPLPNSEMKTATLCRVHGTNNLSLVINGGETIVVLFLDSERLEAYSQEFNAYANLGVSEFSLNLLSLNPEELCSEVNRLVGLQLGFRRESEMFTDQELCY